MRKLLARVALGVTIGTGLAYILTSPKTPEININTGRTETRTEIAQTEAPELIVGNTSRENPYQDNNLSNKQKQNTSQDIKKYLEDYLRGESVQRSYTREGFIDYVTAIINKPENIRIEDFLEEMQNASQENKHFLEEMYGGRQALDEARLRLEVNKHGTVSEYVGSKDLEKIAIDLWNNGMDKSWKRYGQEKAVVDAVSNYAHIKSHVIPDTSLESFTEHLLDIAISEGKIAPYSKEQREAINSATRRYDSKKSTENENEVQKLLVRPTDTNPTKEIARYLKNPSIRDAFILGKYMQREN